MPNHAVVDVGAADVEVEAVVATGPPADIASPADVIVVAHSLRRSPLCLKSFANNRVGSCAVVPEGPHLMVDVVMPHHADDFGRPHVC